MWCPLYSPRHPTHYGRTPREIARNEQLCVIVFRQDFNIGVINRSQIAHICKMVDPVGWVQHVLVLAQFAPRSVKSERTSLGVHRPIDRLGHVELFTSDPILSHTANLQPILSVWVWGQDFFLFSFFMPYLACYQKVWVKAFYCPKMSL